MAICALPRLNAQNVNYMRTHTRKVCDGKSEIPITLHGELRKY